MIALLAAGTALASCATQQREPVPVVPVAEAPAEAPAVAAKPELGSFGFDATGMDTTVLPGDNFYQYANGTWARYTPIPADKSNYGMFTKLDDLSRERTRTIVEEAAKDPANKIGAAYASFLDEAAVEAKGLAPFEPWLGEVRALDGKAGYAALLARAERLGIGTPFPMFIGQDDKQPDQYGLFMVQGGLGMPHRDYYLCDASRRPARQIVAPVTRC